MFCIGQEGTKQKMLGRVKKISKNCRENYKQELLKLWGKCRWKTPINRAF